MGVLLIISGDMGDDKAFFKQKSGIVFRIKMRKYIFFLGKDLFLL